MVYVNTTVVCTGVSVLSLINLKRKRMEKQANIRDACRRELAIS